MTYGIDPGNGVRESLPRQYLVGVDSGGTHTNIRIVGPDGKAKNIPELNRSLTSNRSDHELKRTFDDIFTAIRVRTGTTPTFIWVSAAGYAASTRERLESFLRPLGVNTESIGMSNDGVTLILAHEPATVAVVAGTGSVAMARKHSGEVVTRGGDEWVVADYGSAFWIGLNGIRAAYRFIEGGTPTALKDCFLDQFSRLTGAPHDGEEHSLVRMVARRLASEGTDTKRTIASFAPQVTLEAEKGDEVAQEIVTVASEELAASAAKVYRELATSSNDPVLPRFVLSGSVASHSPFYAETFRASLDRFLFDVREALKCGIELKIQLNGMAESVSLASGLSRGESPPGLDKGHPYSLIP